MIRRRLFAAGFCAALSVGSIALAQQSGRPQPVAEQGVTTDAGCPDGQCSDESTGNVPTRKPNLLKRTWSSICRDFKRNNHWPDPFVASDRVSARAPFDINTRNGWRIQNTLSDHHFIDDRGQLTAAGKLRVAAIINESPLAYRAVFILRNPDPGVNVERVASVQEAIAAVIGDRPPVPIYETYDKPRGASAYYIDEVARRYEATIPDPRIPENDEASSGSGISGSGGASGSN